MDVPGVEDHKQSRKSEHALGSVEPHVAPPVDIASLARVRENITEAIRILVLRRWFFLVPFCLAMVLVTTASHFLPRAYTATTTFERVDDEVLQNLPVRGEKGSFLPFRETLRRDIRSPKIMDEVVVQLGLDDDLPREPDGNLTTEGRKTLQRIGQRLAFCVTAHILRSAVHKDTIQLAYRGPEIKIAAGLLDAIRDAYINQTRAKITERIQENKEYFDTETAKRGETVDSLEYQQILSELELPNIDSTKPDIIFVTLTSLKNEERELKRKWETVRTKLNKTKQYVESIMAMHSTSSFFPNDGVALKFKPVAKDSRVRQVEAEIDRIDAEIEDLKIRRQMTDKHPEIVDLRKLRQRYKQVLVKEYGPFGPVPNRGVDLEEAVSSEQSMGEVWYAAKLRAEMDLVSYEDEAERIAGSLRVVQADIEALEEARDNVPAARRAFRELKEKLNLARTDYEFYAKTAQQYAFLLAADEDERGIGFTVIKPAVAQSKPISPKSKSVLFLALLIGTGAGVVLVLLAELFDRSYHTNRQVVQSLGLNILEVIDEIVTSADRVRRFRRKFIFAPVVVVVLLGTVGLSTSMAYLSLERPTMYDRLMHKPRSVWTNVADAFVGATPRSHEVAALLTTDRVGKPVTAGVSPDMEGDNVLRLNGQRERRPLQSRIHAVKPQTAKHVSSRVGSGPVPSE